jgi:hypothetical protein
VGTVNKVHVGKSVYLASDKRKISKNLLVTEIRKVEKIE